MSAQNTEESTYDNASDRVDGMVIYTDGGSRPNGKYMGWGIHGYSYKDVIPKKGTGNPTHYPSSCGYLPKSDKKEGSSKTEVTPINYFDGYGCTLEYGTNNLAEILAAKLATEKAIDINPKKLLIRSDSEYVIKGSTDFSYHWVKNNWKKPDGSPVPNAPYWKKLLANYDVLRNNGCDIKIEWVKGHSDFLGNQIADRLATVGVMGSTNLDSKEQVDISPAEGYWKNTVNKHPFFCFKTCYFTTLSKGQNKGEYFIGEQDKDVEFIGKRKSDGSYAVFYLKEPEPIVDLVRKYQTELTGDFDNICLLRLNYLFTHHVYTFIEKYGKNAIVKKFNDKIDLWTTDKEPLTKELVPPRIAQRSIDALSNIKDILLKYKAGTLEVGKYNIVNLNHIFYETKETVKKKETITTTHLKSSIGSGFNSFNVDIDIGGKFYKVILSLGIDLPNRNTLKALEDNSIKINLIWWYDSDKVIRYATIIEYKEDYGIWAGYYSNMIFLD